jgi:nitrogen fixation NifU-like protein
MQASSSGELRDLYRQLILEHAKSPRHFGRLADSTHSARGLNPLCGDKMHLYLAVDDEQRLTEASFEGSGCAISIASASLLTDAVVGMRVGEAEQFAETVCSVLDGSADASSAELGELRALEGIREFPSRIKCATLAWQTMKSALANDDQPATTE